MGTAKKLKNLFYGLEGTKVDADTKTNHSNNSFINEKIEVEAYLKKIQSLLTKNPSNAKKAALVIQQMIEQTQRNKK